MRYCIWVMVALVMGITGVTAQVAPWGSGDIEEKPPIDFLITGYQATGAIHGEVGKFTSVISVSVFAQGWLEIPLLPKGCSLSKFSVTGNNGSKLLLTRKKGKYVLMCGKADNYVLKVDFVTQVTQEGIHNRVTVPFVPAVSSMATIELPGEVSDLATTPAVKIEKSDVGEKTQVIIYGDGSTEIALSWKERPRMETIKPLVFADPQVSAYIARGLVRVKSRIHYTVLQGALPQLKLSYPLNANLMELQGQNIRTWNVSMAEGKQQILVDLVKPIEKEYVLSVVLEHAIAEIPGNLNIPTPTPEDVAREKGLIAVYTRPAIKVEPGKVTGASQVDVHDSDVLKSIAREGDYQLGLAYKYLTRPFAINVLISLVQPKVTATSEILVSVSRESLRTINWVEYDIRDAGVFRFRFTISENNKLLDIKGENINNWRMKDRTLEVDLRSKAQGKYLLTIETEQALAGKKQVVLPSLVLMDVTRQTGYVAVSPRLDTKVEAVSHQQATQIDIKKLPSRLKNAPDGVSLAYRYVKQPNTIKIAIGRIQPELHVEVFSAFTLKEKELLLDAMLEYDVRKAGIFELRIVFPAELRLVDTIYGEFIDDWRIDKEKQQLIVSFRSKVDGKYTLRLSATRSLEEEIKTLKLPVLRPLDVKKDMGYISMRAETSVRLKTSQSKNISEIDINELPVYFRGLGEKFTLAYKYFRQPWTITLAVEPIQPVITAKVFNLAAIGDGLEQTSSQIDYDIQYAGVASFLIKLPTEAKNVNINGANIRHRGPTKEDATIWKVDLQSKIKKPYTLFVTFERKMQGTSGTVLYRGLQTLGIEREEGIIAVAPRGNVEIMPVEAGIRNIQLIDAQEIPKKYRQGISIPIIWSFKYIAHPYQIQLEATKHEDVEALVAVVEQAILTTLVSVEGETLTDFTLIMKNNRKQFLRFLLPEGANIMDGFVGGRSVRLGRSKVKHANKEYVVTLVPISGVAGPGEAFPVKIIYQLKLDNLGSSGSLHLECPGVDVPIMRLGWELRLPPKYDINLNFGDLRRVYSLHYLNQRVVSEQNDYISRFSRRNNKVAFNKIQRNLEIQQIKQRTRTFAGTASAVSTQMMKKLGETSRTFYFEKLLATTADTSATGTFIMPGSLKIRHTRESLRVVMSWLLAIIILVIGWYIRKQPGWIRYELPIIIALLLMGIYTLNPEAYPQILSVAIAVIWLVLALNILEWVIKFLKTRMPKWESVAKPKPKKKANTIYREPVVTSEQKQPPVGEQQQQSDDNQEQKE